MDGKRRTTTVRTEVLQWALPIVLTLGGLAAWRLASAYPVLAQEAGGDGGTGCEG